MNKTYIVNVSIVIKDYDIDANRTDNAVVPALDEKEAIEKITSYYVRCGYVITAINQCKQLEDNYVAVFRGAKSWCSYHDMLK